MSDPEGIWHFNCVDSVTGMFADELDVDRAQIDIVCGGSQKALSAPAGTYSGSSQRGCFRGNASEKGTNPFLLCESSDL